MKPSIFKKALVVYLIISLLALEVLSRVALMYNFKVPFFAPQNIIYHYYPELKAVNESIIDRGNGVFDILLLGNSTLSNEWGSVEAELREQLGNRSDIKIHNLSKAAHTSLDSRINFMLLEKKYFDFIILYGGINETRANNCPLDKFAADYSHFSWYREIYAVLRHPEMQYTVIPFMLDLIISKCQKNTGIPTHAPKGEWVEYGKVIKTTGSFRQNYLEIIGRAQQLGIPVMIMSFAFYIPLDYTKEKFASKELDYSKHKLAIEIWGEPDYVQKGIEAHNEVIKEIAGDASFKKLYYLDMNNMLEKGMNNFDDICHFTGEGSSKFVAYLLPIIRKEMRNF